MTSAPQVDGQRCCSKKDVVSPMLSSTTGHAHIHTLAKRYRELAARTGATKTGSYDDNRRPLAVRVRRLELDIIRSHAQSLRQVIETEGGHEAKGNVVSNNIVNDIERLSAELSRAVADAAAANYLASRIRQLETEKATLEAEKATLEKRFKDRETGPPREEDASRSHLLQVEAFRAAEKLASLQLRDDKEKANARAAEHAAHIENLKAELDASREVEQQIRTKLEAVQSRAALDVAQLQMALAASENRALTAEGALAALEDKVAYGRSAILQLQTARPDAAHTLLDIVAKSLGLDLKPECLEVLLQPPRSPTPEQPHSPAGTKAKASAPLSPAASKSIFSRGISPFVSAMNAQKSGGSPAGRHSTLEGLGFLLSASPTMPSLTTPSPTANPNKAPGSQADEPNEAALLSPSFDPPSPASSMPAIQVSSSCDAVDVAVGPKTETLACDDSVSSAP